MARRDSEGEVAAIFRYGLLMGLGIAATFIFYWSAVTSVQVIALGSGYRPGELRGLTMWATAGVLLIGALPILRFVIADLPDMTASAVREGSRYAAWMSVLLIGVAVLVFF
ncbi:MAG: hypothetical protein R3D33_08145 [Hyphomicrobiaceae bacterium]